MPSSAEGGGGIRAFPRLMMFLTGAIGMLLLCSVVYLAYPALSGLGEASKTEITTTSTPKPSTIYPSGFNVTMRDSDGETVLHRIAKLEDEAAIRELINLGADVNAKNNDDRTPLHYAAREARETCGKKTVASCLSVINLLVEHGADVNAKDRGGNIFLNDLFEWFSSITPAQLHQVAVEYGHLFNVRNKNGETVLDLALSRVEFEIATLSLLYKKGVDFRAVNPWNQETVLSSAISGLQSVPVLSKLIEFGADYRRLDSRKQSVLHLASSRGRADELKFFIGIGKWGSLDINGKDDTGCTPLHVVGRLCVFSSCKPVEAVRLLLDNGASKTMKTDAGETPYDRVLKHSDLLDKNKEEVLQLLSGNDTDSTPTPTPSPKSPDSLSPGTRFLAWFMFWGISFGIGYGIVFCYRRIKEKCKKDSTQQDVV